MIIKKGRAKNFFSIGNSFVEIDFQKHKQAVLSGKNGNGKSTMFSLVTFGLFGKTIKPVTKAQIINSINGKNCLVEIEVSANGKDYLVRRGIKPNVFEIFENGVLLDQSVVLDYQAYLEENILKCSYRTFLQTSIISIENYKPFMSLAAKERRDFIEDILDIKIFSTMNVLVKAKITKNKEELRLLDTSMRGLKEKIILQKTHIATLEEMNSAGLEALNDKMSEFKKELATNKKILKDGEKETARLTELGKALALDKTANDYLVTQRIEVRTKIASSEKEIAFFETNDNCPTCRQGIAHDHVSSIRDTHNLSYTELLASQDNINERLKSYVDINDRLTDYRKEFSAHQTTTNVATSNVERITKSIKGVDSDIAKLGVSINIQEQKDYLAEFVADILELRNRQTEINEEQDYNAVMLELFKDTGIKSKIVDQYIPVINLLVNQYLDKLDFFVSFNLNSEFNETIKSRHRDDFTYSSFSAGEKMRIDIALMFTFRQLAKMRNSFSCNLLCLDELFDASCDADGIELLMNIFDAEEFNETNLMVISHGNKERFEERFDGAYEFVKRDGFSVMKE